MRETKDERLRRLSLVLNQLISASELSQREIGRRLSNGDYLVRRVVQGDTGLKVGQLFELADAIEVHPVEVILMVFPNRPVGPSPLVKKLQERIALLTALQPPPAAAAAQKPPRRPRRKAPRNKAKRSE